MITGAKGKVATLLVPRIRDRFSLTLVDRVPDSGDRAGYRQIDVCDTGAMAAALVGVDALVHLAGQSAPRATWAELCEPNINGVVSVFEAARRAGVPKLIFASTNHVTGMYDLDQKWPLSPSQPIRPDSLYGATKAFGEAMGRFYSDMFAMSVICVRIGWVLERPHNEEARMMWLSPGDLTRFVCCALASDVRFGIYYGVSNNKSRRWSIENARRDLGYEPSDDSEDYFRAT
jgi:nucleoside-diphosphate-sugar epimerase